MRKERLRVYNILILTGLILRKKIVKFKKYLRFKKYLINLSIFSLQFIITTLYDRKSKLMAVSIIRGTDDRNIINLSKTSTPFSTLTSKIKRS